MESLRLTALGRTTFTTEEYIRPVDSRYVCVCACDCACVCVRVFVCARVRARACVHVACVRLDMLIRRQRDDKARTRNPEFHMLPSFVWVYGGRGPLSPIRKLTNSTPVSPRHSPPYASVPFTHMPCRWIGHQVAFSRALGHKFLEEFGIAHTPSIYTRTCTVSRLSPGFSFFALSPNSVCAYRQPPRILCSTDKT